MQRFPAWKLLVKSTLSEHEKAAVIEPITAAFSFAFPG